MPSSRDGCGKHSEMSETTRGQLAGPVERSCARIVRLASEDDEKALQRVRKVSGVRSEMIKGSGKPIPFLVGMFILAGLVVVDYGAFRLLDHSYFHWYPSPPAR